VNLKPVILYSMASPVICCDTCQIVTSTWYYLYLHVYIRPSL